MKKALITGINGQDGSYLAELLLEKGYEVHGIKRPTSSLHTPHIDHLYQSQQLQDEKRFFLHYGDVTDTTNLIKIIATIWPNEIYHLAAQSHVRISFDIPEYTANTDALGTLRILEAIKMLKAEKHIRFYQASTSELYGNSPSIPQDEQTPFAPCSPYAVAKLYAYWITVNYREAYNMFACNGILFNHESPRRGETFVTRKITRAVAQIQQGGKEKLYLGNLDAQRDWGYAKDYVEAMWLMLQQETAQDYVIATGVSHSVREFVITAFAEVDIPIEWHGHGIDQKGYHGRTGELLIAIDPRHFRPTEVNHLCGRITKAENQLGWKPTMNFDSLVRLMVHHDLQLIAQHTLNSKKTPISNSIPQQAL